MTSQHEVDRTRPSVHLHIAGERLAEGSGGAYQHIDPSTGQVDQVIPLAGRDEVERAVESAHAAFATWRRTTPAVRRSLLFRLAELIEQHGAELARRDTLDNGVPISVAGGLIPRAAEWTRYYAGLTDQLVGEVTGSYRSHGELSYTLPEPYGVIGVITTWNGPIASIAMKLPALLAAGNTAVMKPSELAPFTAELVAELVVEAGFPPGVVNIVPGRADAGEALVDNPLVKKITFTGGPSTARAILRSCAEQMKPAVMELGGKSANLLFADVDVDVAAACEWSAARAIGTRSGQGCALATRLLVHDDIYDEVVERTAALVARMRVGDPFEPETTTGPLISAPAVDRVLGIIERAPKDGARLIVGGRRVGGALRDGYFVEPTVFADVDPLSELGQTEVFGPVLAIMRFADEAEAIEIANSTPYALAAYVQTADLRRAQTVAEALDAGGVMINGAAPVAPHRPFGGSGQSGYGREGGRQGLDEFLQFKSVAFG